jgi:uncharacterized protein DUF4826
MTQAQGPLTKEEANKNFNEWAQKEFVRISKFCATKGYNITGIEQPRCQLLPPLIGLWYAKTSEKNVDLWVISGDFPTDMAKSDIAKNAREAMRHFSMSWHIQAARLEDGIAEGRIELQDEETQSKFAADLTSRAESLYDIFNSDELWKNTNLTV